MPTPFCYAGLHINKKLKLSIFSFKDLAAIQGMTKDLNTNAGFPSGARPFFYHEVIDQGGEPIKVNEYFGVGNVIDIYLW